MTTQTTITLVESDTINGQYDMPLTIAIVDTQDGRLLVSQAFGGMDTMAGGAVRWRNGIAVKLQPTDTLASLRAGEWNEHTSLMDAVLGGHDNSRPVLDWSGRHIADIADKAGL